jgi:chemotaxis protein methyltransferase CheR
MSPESEDLEPYAVMASATLGLAFGPARRGDLGRAVAAAAAAMPDDGTSLLERLRRAGTNDPVWAAFSSALAVRETYFMRSPAQFDAIAATVLPDLVSQRARSRRLRFWSAGCASGEEAYTLAILAGEHVPADWDVTILGTDVDEEALAAARAGRYGRRSFRAVPDEWRDRWFTPAGNRFELDESVRRRVRFEPHNLGSSPYPAWENGTSNIDLLMCRNVLIYFEPSAVTRTVERLARCLSPGGWLAVAPAEVPFAQGPGLEACALGGTVLYQRGSTAVVRPHRPAPRRPMAGAICTAPAERRPSLEDAHAAADRGDRDTALRLAGAVTRADPLCAEGHLLQGLLLMDAEDFTGAAEALRRTLFLDPDSEVARAAQAALTDRQRRT